VARVILKDIPIDRLWLQAVKLRGSQMRLPKRRLVLNRINAILCSIDISQRIRLVDRLRHLTGGTSVGKSQALVAEGVVHHLLIVVTSEVIHMFSLQFVLDTLAIWRVPNQRKNRSNAFH
jgi:hypothetical protein